MITFLFTEGETFSTPSRKKNEQTLEFSKDFNVPLYSSQRVKNTLNRMNTDFPRHCQNHPQTGSQTMCI